MGIKTVVEEEGGQEKEKGEEEEEGGQVFEGGKVPYAQQPFYYFCLTHCLGLGFPRNWCGRRG